MAESASTSYSTDPALYLYTSLTSGSSQIVTATSRLETILKANRIPFKALDIATDEKARMLWGRRSGKDETGRVRKIPGLVQMGLVIGDLVEIEEWNEYGELKEHVTIYHEGGIPANTVPNLLKSAPSKPLPLLQENKKPVPAAKSSKDAEVLKTPTGGQPTSFTLAMRQAGQEAAQKAKDAKKKVTETFTGIGEAEPEKKDIEKDEPKTASTSIFELQSLSDKIAIVAPTLLQNPASSAWSMIVEAGLSLANSGEQTATIRAASIESPTSISWKPTQTDNPVPMRHGSSISSASNEDVKKIEEESAILEEDENTEEAV